MALRRICQSTLYYLWLLLAVVVIVAALAVSSLRLLVPHAEHIKQPLVDWFLDTYQMKIDYKQLDLQWSRFGLYVSLSDVNVDPTDGVDRLKGIDLMSLRIDPLASLMAREVRFGDIRMHGVELDISTIDTSGESNDQQSPAQQLMVELVGSRFKAFELSDLVIHLGDEQEIPSLHIPYLTWTNSERLHQGEGRIQMGPDSDETVKFIVKLSGNEQRPKKITGQLYIEVNNLSPHPFVQPYLGDEITITDSLLSFETWVSFGWDSIDQVMLRLDQNRLAWRLPLSEDDDDHQLVIEKGYLSFNAEQQGWHLFSDDLDVHTNGELWRDLNLKIWQREEQIQASVEYVDLSLIAPLLEWIPERWELPIPKQVPLKGAVRDLMVSYQDAERWQIQANFANVGWPKIDNMPGAELVNGDIYLNQHLLQLELSAPPQLISTGELFYHDIELERLDAFFQAYRHDWGWQFELPKLILRATDLSAEVVAQGRMGPDLPNELYLYAELDLADAGHADYYFPLPAMGADLADYLSESLQSGQAKGAQILWHGPLANFPYDDGSGMFQAYVPLRNSRFKFSPDWPALEPLDLDLQFENSDLNMLAQQARLYDVHVDDLVARIPGLSGDSVLSIDGNISGSSTSVREVMRDSMLADSLGETLDLMDLKGPVWGPLSLKIPLDNAEAVEVSGFAQLEQAELLVPGTHTHYITDASGRIDYQQQNFRIEKLLGNYHQLPVTISVSGDQKGDDYLVDGTIDASWQAEQLRQLPDFWVPGLTGRLDTHAKVQSRIDDKGPHTEITIRSDLSPLTIDLPAPFAKPADQAQQLLGNITISAAHQFDMTFQLGDVGQLRWLQDLSVADSAASIWIGVGAEPPEQIEAGLSLDISQPHIDINQWLAVLDQQHSATPSSLPFDRGHWHFDQIEAEGWYLEQVNIEMEKTPLGWQARLSGPAAEGSVRFDSLEQPLLDIKLSQFNLQQLEPESSTPAAPLPPATPAAEFVPAGQNELANIPDLDVLCNTCVVNNVNLGEVRLKSVTQPKLGLWQIEEAWLKNPHGQITLEQFDWRLAADGDDAPAQPMTTLKGKLKVSNFGKYAEAFVTSGENPIKDSDATGELNFSWPGAPYQFNPQTAEGVFAWELGPGYVSELSDKGARVFTLLSIDSLVRKIRLDFSDVFDKGLHYNSFEGDFVLKDGYVNSKQLEMDGVAGDMFINGRTNLATRELDYDVVFNPNITGSLPLLSALTFNPFTGLAVLAVSTVIKPAVEVVTQVRFKVSGTTSNPVVEEVGRSSKEVELQKPKTEPQLLDEVLPDAAEAGQSSAAPTPSTSPEAPAPVVSEAQLLPELPTEQPITVGDTPPNE
ncbi:TIGR02099 family protein [Neiella sp. HB171785]|uniref:TIGR02099 family protein n=1 Tax=Neiella litorisoli TaxID=2771431 RepID=A0A8J6QKF8_9GAMM|nr:YhdP family protein [Neiella litorisoli]MBD1389876.1 TIGR02099 family protein [Neiella litorisoli]